MKEYCGQVYCMDCEIQLCESREAKHFLHDKGKSYKGGIKCKKCEYRHLQSKVKKKTNTMFGVKV